ncbi:hypothetical protein BD769DRAFT_1392110 [Suillus cothurnatus]|nr:hypothetical protein BD769DRAFT_1392110 [Suillus cothurnatus]
MTVSSSSDDQITLWRTWALTVTHEACEYTEQMFNAEKTGGDPVIPSPNLDTELVMACDQLADILIKAYKNPIQMQVNIARYSKLISPKDTRHNEEREEKLLQRCPPGHEGTMLIDKPATIVNVYGAIIAWYLPDALTNATQVDSNWRTSQEWFKQSSEHVGITPGCINLSPAWYQQGHENLLYTEVSASLKGQYSAYGIQDLISGTWVSGLNIWNSIFSIWDSGLDIWNLGLNIGNSIFSLLELVFWDLIAGTRYSAYLELGFRDLISGTQYLAYLELRFWDLILGFRDLISGTQYLAYGMWDSISGTRVPALDIWHLTDRQGIWDLISGT